ncbi:VOC family protein [Parasphingorhabdus sp.]|uniref:VOC family protein n=1 Tax=Parasphingorhabdus sp. TaxID=2709688 RepID=UPI003A910071
MTLKIVRDSIDLGIVTANESAMREFYQELLGLEEVGEVPIEKVGRIIKLQCGTSVIKLFVLNDPPQADAAANHYLAVTGLRYFTIHIGNLRQVIEECRVKGVNIVNDIVEPRPGVMAALIADPDGNTVELMESA